jgi:hypothetical protein
LGLLGAPTLARPVGAGHANGAMPTSSFGRARRCILLFLTGGPPQHDTWDPKPDAPAEIRGELRPIATSVAGIQISELFPRLARRADKYCIVRSVTHGDTVHTSAGYTMLTGVVHPKANSPTAALVRPTPDDHPHLGAIVAKFRGARTGLPTAVSLPEYIRDAAVNDFPGQDGGFLGRSLAPLLVEADDQRTGFRPPEIVLPGDVTASRLEQRRFLIHHLDRALQSHRSRDLLTGMDQWYAQAFDLLQSPAVRAAFELDREPQRIRDAYGPHLFGLGCLLARRLVEVGVTLVTVYWHYEGPDDSPVWDTHWNNFPHLRRRLMPPTDQAFAALLDDLASRGLLSDTLVVCMGEFGRTPRINKMGGRDHWPHVQSIVLAGAGVPVGRVYGASDRTGSHPADRPVAPVDLTASLLHLLGVPPDFEVPDRTGRAIPACAGRPIAGLIG